MKKSLVLLTILSTTLLLSSCGKEEKKIETNSRGIPMNIADIIIGDSYDIDTLYKSENNVVIHIDNTLYTQQIIYQNDQLLANSPTLDVDSIAPSIYEINDLLRSARVNFSNPQSVEKFKSIYPTYPDYTTVVVGDTSTVGQKAVFAFAASVPEEKMRYSAEITRWIEHNLEDTIAYQASVKKFGEKMERDFFTEWSKKESEFQYANSRSMLLYQMSQSYVTYYDYFWGYFGGAHGIFYRRFISYSLTDNCPITYEYLFKLNCEDEIRELIYEALAADEDFMNNNSLTSLSQARSYVQRYLCGEPLPIPTPGILPQGVVFCYQPYDIAPYVAGAFQLVIPYSKISKYFARNPL